MDEEGEIDLKPRARVLAYLEATDTHVAIAYLEYVLQQFDERSSVFHSKLAHLYLHRLCALAQEKDHPPRPSGTPLGASCR